MFLPRTFSPAGNSSGIELKPKPVSWQGKSQHEDVRSFPSLNAMNAKHLRPQAAQRAFQLKDLACVLAVVGLLASVQLASLANGRESSVADRCRDNIRRLTLAWQMYSDDNLGRLVPNNGNVGEGGTADSQKSWVSGWLDFSTSFDNINTDYLVAAEKNGNYGHLGPYVRRDVSVFRCPADASDVLITGRWFNRVRTVSMNNWMGGNAYCGGGYNYNENRAQSEISRPSQRWVIAEESPASINDGLLLVRMDQEYIVDYPSAQHSGGTWFGFTDGRAEFRRWVDPRTLPGYRASELIPLNVPSPGNADMAWLRERTTDKKPGAPL